MHCPHCEADVVAFAVPDDLHDHAEADQMAVCTVCLRTTSVEDESPEVQPTDEADFSAVHESFPDGRGGVALALAAGKLGSLALERAAIEELLVEAERAGADVWMTFDRLATAGALEPHFDVARRAEQLQSF